MSANISQYLSLITSEHRDKPKFMAAVAAAVGPFADIAQRVASIPGLYDLDTAVGAQLDAVGKWVGVTRELRIPLENVFFSFGVEGLGFGEGTWKGPYDSDSGLTLLPDDTYRQLLFVAIARNHWDGTVPSAYAIWSTMFTIVGNAWNEGGFSEGGYGTSQSGRILIQDNQDMTITMVIISSVMTAVMRAMILNHYFDMVPAGVRVGAYYTSSVAGAPVFGFGLSNDSVAGFGSGAWITNLS